MIRVVEAKISDPFLIKELLPCYCDVDREVAARNIAMDNKLSFSLIDDKKLLGCVGGLQWLSGVFGIWAILSKDIKEHGISYHRTIKELDLL
jgi:hypothetical protein